MAAARDPTAASATGSVGFCPGSLIFVGAPAFAHGCRLCHPFNVDHLSVIDANTRYRQGKKQTFSLGVWLFLEHFTTRIGSVHGHLPDLLPHRRP
jgi:high-affinity nickel permease